MADNMNLSRIQQLPNDSLHEIFLRLPATTLCGMRRLCRTFRVFIDRHEFATAHFTRHRAISWEEGTPMIGIQIVCRDHWFLRGWNHGISGGGKTIGPFVKGQIHFDGLFNLQVAGTADGLVMLQHTEYLQSLSPWEVTQLTLWNPLLGKTFIIPKSPKQLQLRASVIRQQALQAHVGFGRDPDRHDYKVVVVVVKSDPGYAALWSWVEVYHIGANLWQSYDLGDHQSVIWGNQVRVERTMHQILGLCYGHYEGRIDHSCVMSFNPDTGSIRYTEFPQGFGELIRIPVSCNGSLAVFTLSYNYTRLHVLQEDGNWVAEWIQHIGKLTPARYHLFLLLKAHDPLICNAVFLLEQNCLLISRYGWGFVLFDFLNNNVQYYDGQVTFLNTFKGSLLWTDSLYHD